MRAIQIATFLSYLSLASYFIPAKVYGAPAEPVVARVQMQLKKGDEVIDVIERGDLLTVVEEQQDAYIILTVGGKRGLLSKANAAKVAESVELYNELLKENPKDGRLLTLRASAWWVRGDAQRALEDYDSAIEAGYTEPHVYSSRGMLYAAINQHDKALADLDVAIEQGAKDDSPYLSRAAVYMTQRKFDLAIKDYGEAIRRNPKKATNYQQRAVAYKISGKLDSAVEEFGKAIKLNPKLASAWMGRGFVWFQKEESSRAVEDFSEVIKLDPKSAQAYNNRGYNRQLLGNEEDALADFDEAISLAPNYGLAYQNKAWLLATSNNAAIRDGKKAVEAATKACELGNYKEVADVKALAAAFAEAGDFGRAIGWQEKVVALVAEDEKPTERQTLEKFKAKQPLRFEEQPAPKS